VDEVADIYANTDRIRWLLEAEEDGDEPEEVDT
jgi:hypothetical protein